MPDPIPPQGTNPTTPGLTPADLQSRQAQVQQGRQQANAQQQAKLQQQADKSEKSIFRRVYNKTITIGSLLAFQYSSVKNQIHDPFPLVLVGKLNDWGKPGMIAGLNLHYLTFRYMKYLTQQFCGKNFNYRLIKGNRYIVNAYRSYAKEGRKQVKVLDCEFLNKVLTTARSFKPTELEAIRQEVQRQLREKMHPTAEQVAKQYQENVWKQSHKAYNTGRTYPDARYNPTDILPPE